MSSKRKAGKAGWIVLIALVLCAAGLTAYYYKSRSSAAYESVKAQLSDITTYTSFSGNVEAKKRQTVIAETIMQIADVYVEEGDMVEKGQVLADTTTGEEIVADIAGEVAGVYVEENAMVIAGTKLMGIVDYSNLEIKVRVDEYDISSLKKGKEAFVKIGALNKEIKGKISNVSREGVVVNGIALFTATVDLEKHPDLRVGMSAEVRLINKTAGGVVTIPMSTVQFDNNNMPYVLKENDKGRPIRTNIETGINNGTLVEVKKGVANGETVLYHGRNNDMDMSFPGRNGAGANRSTNTGGFD